MLLEFRLRNVLWRIGYGHHLWCSSCYIGCSRSDHDRAHRWPDHPTDNRLLCASVHILSVRTRHRRRLAAVRGRRSKRR